MRQIIFYLILFILPLISLAQNKEKEVDLETIIRSLASEDFEGRAPNTKGDSLTCDLISESFESIGLKKFNDSYFQVISFNNRDWRGKNPSAEIQTYYSRNIIGIIPGNDKDLKNEYVIIGAHHDHLGFGGRMSGSRVQEEAIHFGADDNASGVGLMIDLAKKFSNKPTKRTLIFIGFAAEEKGLVGSKAFVENPLIDLSKVNAMINFDMVGNLKNNAITAGGSKTSTKSEELILKHSSKHGLKPSLSPNGHGPSDHAPFYGKNIPVFYFTTGADHTYHTPLDNAENINYKGIELISDFVYDLVEDIANNDKLIFQETAPSSTPTMQSFKVTLGLMPDVTGSTDKGLKADLIIKDRPAYKAGMKNGDIILEMDSIKIENINDYMKALSNLKKDTSVNVKVLRDKEIVNLRVEL